MRDYIPVFAPDFGYDERSATIQHLATDKFITSDKAVEEFERTFGKRLGRHYCTMVNSGSSAMLMAILAAGIKPGDRVLTPTVTFPTTISPLLLIGAVPVFVDVAIETLNIVADEVPKDVDIAVVPHTLGNPVDPAIWNVFGTSVEDACDAFGSDVDGQPCGTFGTVSAFSFYPAHHMTTGEGGMVCCRDSITHEKVRSMVNWGRDCYCRPGYDDSCGHRFDYEVDGIPYDHKYTFSNLGFNLKPLEMQGVIGRTQLAKAGKFDAIRKRNFSCLDKALCDIDSLIIRPRSCLGATPSWFGYPITLRTGNRREITQRIEQRGVATRLMFGGNITRQPFMKGRKFEVAGKLDNADKIMRDTFIVGCNHSIDEEEIARVAKVVKEEIAACSTSSAKMAI